MKTLLSIATLTLASALLVGCQASTKSAPSHPLSAEVVAQLQAEFVQADSGARVGSIDEVKSDVRYVAVGQINGSDFPIGTSVAIIDSNKQVIALGTVKQMFDSTVHVKYEKKPGQREPRVGDAAVKFTEKF